jgi:peroxiredoxin
MKTALVLLAAFLSTAAFAPATGYEVGSKATDFKLKNIDDKEVSLADFKEAKGFIVVFTCNHCPFSKKYENRLIALDKRFKRQGYPVIAINPNDEVSHPEDSFEKMKERAKEKGFTFPYLRDESQQIATTYGAAKTPHVYILKKEGADLVVKYIGAIDDNSDNEKEVKEKYVESAVNNLLAGKEVSPSLTKAIGCGIKWKK